MLVFTATYTFAPVVAPPVRDVLTATRVFFPSVLCWNSNRLKVQITGNVLNDGTFPTTTVVCSYCQFCPYHKSYSSH